MPVRTARGAEETYERIKSMAITFAIRPDARVNEVELARALNVSRTPLREALDAFVDKTQEHVTGTVALSLYKGNVSVVSRKSEFSLYRTDLSSFTMGDSYDQKDAEGYIRILGLPSRSYAQVHAEKVKEALK